MAAEGEGVQGEPAAVAPAEPENDGSGIPHIIIDCACPGGGQQVDCKLAEGARLPLATEVSPEKLS